MTAKAHRDSRKFVPDPFRSAGETYPPDPMLPEPPFWLYGHYEYEAFVLERMVREKDEAKLKVGYTKARRVPRNDAYFAAEMTTKGKVVFRASGAGGALLDGRRLCCWKASESLERKEILIDAPGQLVVYLLCRDAAENIPALLVEEGPTEWRYSTDGKTWSAPVPRCRNTAGLPPHAFRPASPPLELLHLEHSDIFDASREMFGRVEIRCGKEETPELFVGESLGEMENRSPEDEEQTRELVPAGPGLWYSKVPLAFRYLKVEGAPGARARVIPELRPAAYKGGFAVPADPELMEIWGRSAWTLRLCMQEFFVDGIKRDRLPWAGDLAVSLLGCAYAFGDAGIIRDSLSVLGAVSARVAHVNGIADFTMWHIINHDLYQLYFKDPAFLEREYPRISDNLEFLLSLRDERGFLRKRENDWFFIDWVPGDKETAVQILFVRALKAGANLAERMGDFARASVWKEEARELARRVREAAFDADRGLFAAAAGSQEFTRHPNLLAVFAGITSPEETSVIGEALAGDSLPRVGTPYMSAFEVLALHRAGMDDAALAKIREIWGGMLAQGASTFWEAFTPGESGPACTAFYGRPFGRSLCHAWATGPLFLLPMILFGAEPTADGWKKYAFSPRPGVTGSLAVPVPGGLLEAEAEAGRTVKLEITQG